jgi:hypothetical protein
MTLPVKGCDECAERQSNNQADGDNDQLTLHQEVLEAS